MAFDRGQASGCAVLEARHAADLQAVLDKILIEDILVEAPGNRRYGAGNVWTSPPFPG